VGAGLLLSYQQSWAELRRNSSDCASEAMRVDDRLQTEFQRCKELHTAFTAFNMELLRIPDLLVVFGEAKTRVGKNALNMRHKYSLRGFVESTLIPYSLNNSLILNCYYWYPVTHHLNNCC
jgi:hypothetical protein